MTEFRDITAPVGGYTTRMRGQGTANRPQDLKTVSELLQAVPARARGFDKVPSPYAGTSNFARAIERFQEAQFGIACGRMEPGNITIARLNRLAAEHGGGNPGDIGGPVTAPKEMMVAIQAHFVSRLRDAVVEKAAQHVGQVRNQAAPHGAAGEKLGARLLWQIHAETLDPVPYQARDKVMAVGQKPWSWCGMYALWCMIHALNKLGSKVPLKWKAGIGIFRAGLKMEPMSIKAPEQLGKGDICVVNERADGVFLNHHLIVADHRPGSRFRTIEGNYWDKVVRTNQSIVRNERGIGEVLQAYRVPDFLDPVVM